MKKIKVAIRGDSLLMNSFPMEKVDGFEKMSKEDQAEVAAYRDPDGILFVPGLNLQRSFVAASTYSKGKGRASLQKVACAAIAVSPERLSLNRKDYAIDSRPVVIKSTGGRIIRNRPRINDWSINFFIEFDEKLLTEKQVRKIVDDAGALVGLLDFRPERKGPFGKFMVTKWE